MSKGLWCAVVYGSLCFVDFGDTSEHVKLQHSKIADFDEVTAILEFDECM